MHNSNEVTQRCPQIYISPTSKYQFAETNKKQYHTHNLRRRTVIKFHAKEVEVGTSMNGNPDETKSPWEGQLTSKALGFVRIQYHTPVIAPPLNPS